MTRLLLDFDGALPATLMARVATVCRIQRCRVLAMMCRPTRHGWHVIVIVTGRMSLLRRVAMQAILGSDWRRESWNVSRATMQRRVPKFWRVRSNVLYARHIRGLR